MSQLWQHPFVSVWKTFGAAVEKKGEVNEQLDREIGKRVFRVTGFVSSNNYIQVPSNAQKQPLALTGRYVYLQLMGIESKPFVIHMDFALSSGIPLRLSISSMFKQYKQLAHVIQIPCVLSPSRWAICCIDIPAIYKLVNPKSPPFTHSLKSIQFCASLRVRGVFTSDQLYDFDSLPRDMRLSQAVNGDWRTRFDWLNFPCTQEATAARPPRVRSTVVSPVPAPALLKPPAATRESFGELRAIAGISASAKKAFFIRLKNENVLSVPVGGNLQLFSKDDHPMALITLHPHSHLEIVSASFDGTAVAAVCAKEPAVVRFFPGAKNQGLLLSAPSMQRIYILEFSLSGKFLAAVGYDGQRKTQIVIWNVHTESADILARQISDHEVEFFKFFGDEFSPKFATAAKDNARIWRMKEGGVLTGMSIPVGAFLKETSVSFTSLACEFRSPSNNFDSVEIEGKIYLGTSAGGVLEISQISRKIEKHYKSVHAAAINCVFAAENFIATAAEDGSVKIWPVDFTAYFLQVENSTPVESIAVSGLRVAVSLKNGAVSSLDLKSHAYVEIFRSPQIPAIAASGSGKICVAGSRGLENFTFSGRSEIFRDLPEPPTSLAYTLDDFQICGFNSGKILIAGKSESREIQVSDASIRLCGKFGPTVFALDRTGSLFSINEPSGEISSISQIEGIEEPMAPLPFARFSENSGLIVVYGGPKILAVWSLARQAAVGRLKLTLKGSLTAFEISDSRLIAGGSEGQVKVFDISSDGRVLHTIEFGVSVTAVSMGFGRVLAGTADNFLRFWNIGASETSKAAGGHTLAPVSQIFALGNRIVSVSRGEVLFWALPVVEPVSPKLEISRSEESEVVAVEEGVGEVEEFEAAAETPNQVETPPPDLEPLEVQENNFPEISIGASQGCNFGAQGILWVGDSLIFALGRFLHFERLNPNREDAFAACPARDAITHLTANATGSRLIAADPSALHAWQVSGKFDSANYLTSMAGDFSDILRLRFLTEIRIVSLSRSGAVSVWQITGQPTIRKLAEARVEKNPLELIILETRRNEFLTVSRSSVVLWLFNEEAGDLEFQLLEFPEISHVDAFCVSYAMLPVVAVCIAQGPELGIFDLEDCSLLKKISLAPNQINFIAAIPAAGDDAVLSFFTNAQGRNFQVDFSESTASARPLTVGFDGQSISNFQVAVRAEESWTEMEALVTCESGLFYVNVSRDCRAALRLGLPGHRISGAAACTRNFFVATRRDSSILVHRALERPPGGVAKFTSKSVCTALEFLNEGVLLGGFADGSLRSFDLVTLKQIHSEVVLPPTLTDESGPQAVTALGVSDVSDLEGLDGSAKILVGGAFGTFGCATLNFGRQLSMRFAKVAASRILAAVDSVKTAKSKFVAGLSSGEIWAGARKPLMRPIVQSTWRLAKPQNGKIADLEISTCVSAQGIVAAAARSIPQLFIFKIGNPAAVAILPLTDGFSEISDLLIPEKFPGCLLVGSWEGRLGFLNLKTSETIIDAGQLPEKRPRLLQSGKGVLAVTEDATVALINFEN